MRDEIKEFTEEMERIMSKHDEKKGDSWKVMTIYQLENKLEEEYIEYMGKEDELVDLANICMMLYHRLGELYDR
jgi:predicted house-cleaning noncanonical NTP pyrophosphatase (MazG superfamily)